MKIYILILFAVVLFSCKNSGKNIDEERINDSSLTITSGKIMQPVYEDSFPRDIWMDSLLKIDFIQKSNHYIDSFSNHTHGIAFLTDSTNKNEILYSAGYNGPDRFETYYQFYIYPDTKRILIYDPVQDAKLTLDDYIKMLSK